MKEITNAIDALTTLIDYYSDKIVIVSESFKESNDFCECIRMIGNYSNKIDQIESLIVKLQEELNEEQS